ncbi:MAG: proton-conducting transporter membrane subunit [Myxococcota bacterium]|jgi:NADH-quinone oxidoreductase subunit N|nr:proton-conducting transporter membrane subunit [Myxococcota bacterium]
MTNTMAAFEALGPPGLLAAGSIVTVLVDAAMHGPASREASSRMAWVHRSLLAVVAGAFVSFALVIAGFNLFFGDRVVKAWGAMLVVDPVSNFAMMLLCSAALIVLLFAISAPKESGVQRGEFYPLLLLSLTGCVTTVCAGNFVSLFFAIELATLPAIALVSLERDRERSLEAGTRLLLVLGFASAITLYGIALLYGARGDLAVVDFATIGGAGEAGAKLVAAGTALVWVGMLTRLGAAPFHHWLPNVCDGASPLAASWASTGLVGVVAFALLRLGPGLDSSVLPGIDKVLVAFAMLSMAIGSVSALFQSSVKRVLAHGAVVHAGLILGVLSVEAQASSSAAALEIATFVVMQLGAFGVLSVLTRERSGGVQLGEFAGLAERAPILAASFALFLLGLAALPGTAGFISRLYAMQVMIASENVVLALVTGAATVVLFAAYLRVAIAMYMLRSHGGLTPGTPLPATIALLVCAVATVAFGVQPAGGLLPIDLLEIVRRVALP